MTTTDNEHAVASLSATEQAPKRIHRLAAYDVVRSVLGLVLVAASTAKVYSILAGGIVESGWLSSRWTLTGAAVFEAVFGIWLLSGMRPRLTRALG